MYGIRAGIDERDFRISLARDSSERLTTSERRIFNAVQAQFRKLGYRVGPVLPQRNKPENDAPCFGGLGFEISKGNFRGFVYDPDYQVRLPLDSLAQWKFVEFSVIQEEEKE